MDADKIHKANPIPRVKLSAGTKQGCDAGMTITSSGAVRFFKIRFVPSLNRFVGLAGNAGRPAVGLVGVRSKPVETGCTHDGCDPRIGRELYVHLAETVG